MTGSSTSLWTTARDFGTVVVVCVMAAVALFALVERAHAGGEIAPYPPPPPPYSDYERGPEPAWMACRPDMRRYCPNVLPGGGRILSCLAGNKDRLSHGCRDALLRALAYRRY